MIIIIKLFIIQCIHAREPLYSQDAVIAWWLQLMSARNCVPSCLKQLICSQYSISENFHRESMSLINPAMYLINMFVG